MFDSSFFFICYPGGDRTKICVVELSDACDYEKNDYDVASRREFRNEDESLAFNEAADYARELARRHGKAYIPDATREKEDAYLD